MASRAISASRARFYLGETEVGMGTSISGTETQSLMRVDALGDAYSKEIVPIRRTVQFTVQHVRFKRGSMKALGAMARGGTAQILDFPPLTAVLYDHIDDEPIETITGCVCEQRNFNLDAQGLLTEGASFQAIKLKDEDES